MGTGGKIKLEEGTAGGTYVGFKAPDTEVTADLLWTLPASDGAAGTFFATDGNKNLSFVDEAGTRAAADSTLQSNLNAEVTARSSANSTLQANLDDEITARANADITLQSNINTEITARTSADSTEITARSNADTTLQSNINSEITARASADSTIRATGITAGTGISTSGTIGGNNLTVGLSTMYYFEAIPSGTTNNITGQVMYNGTPTRNDGNQYNASNSTFTAPVNGIYWFCAQYFSMGGYPGVGALRVNGSTVTICGLEIASNYSSHCLSFTCYLSANDQVTIYNDNGTTDSRLHLNPGLSKFRGGLLRRM